MYSTKHTHESFCRGSSESAPDDSVCFCDCAPVVHSKHVVLFHSMELWLSAPGALRHSPYLLAGHTLRAVGVMKDNG